NLQLLTRTQCSNPRTAPGKSCDQGDDEHHQKDEEQELRDSGRSDCNPAETKDCSDDRNNQKYQRPVKHAASSLHGQMTSIRKSIAHQTAAYDQAESVLQNAICCRDKTWIVPIFLDLQPDSERDPGLLAFELTALATLDQIPSHERCSPTCPMPSAI